MTTGIYTHKTMTNGQIFMWHHACTILKETPKAYMIRIHNWHEDSDCVKRVQKKSVRQIEISETATHSEILAKWVSSH